MVLGIVLWVSILFHFSEITHALLYSFDTCVKKTIRLQYSPIKKKLAMWKKLICNHLELNLEITLGGGQSFRWHKQKEEWRGVISNIVCSFKQDEQGNLLYLVHNSCIETCMPTKVKNSRKRLKQDLTDYFENTIKNYFKLDFNLEDHYRQWSACDAHFKNVGESYKGIRILQQDPVENLFSFICSANNNIPRIISMVEKLCLHYGKKITELDGINYYTFPTVQKLAEDNVEAKLRTLGFGYRAKFISQTARVLQEKSPNWLYNLKNVSYEEAHEALVSLPGVGPKVADCVCLMSLGKYCSIPVDTHIWQVTTRDYLPHLKQTKSLSNKIYKEIGDFYRERFGEYAGWANTVLFASDLKSFKEK